MSAIVEGSSQPDVLIVSGQMVRFAVVRTSRGDQLVIERHGRLLPVDALLTDNERAELPSALDDLAPLLPDWRRWTEVLMVRAQERSANFETAGWPAASAQFRPPIAAPRKLICIGSNYHDHIAEMQIPMLPAYPYSFLKPADNTLRGHGEPVARPHNVAMMDWEAELAVIIGRTARDVRAADALTFVAGYANFNDLSARDWLDDRPPIGVDWVRHKAFDGFAPMGPYVVPAAYVPDPQGLPVQTWVNGQLRQDSNTARMVYGVAAIIEHLSSIMTLEPGDVIATGTPAGVGHGRRPQQFLQPGDEVRIEVGPLGSLVTPIT